MTYFLRNGNTFRPSDELSLDLHHKLPVGNYIIKQDQFGNLFFEGVDSFEFTSKRYGDNIRNTERILSTFLSREASTGVMLAGEKGSGKSLLAKMLSIEAAKQDIPTIIINRPWTGDDFNKFIQDIEQPCVILFDEFEKVYNSEEQEGILTLLDGVFPSKKLFVLTCNDKWRVDSHMRNRPGRIFYMIDFKGLDQEFIIEYCNDNLINKSYIERVCSVSLLFSEFNFDMLKALVEEMNRYNESPEESLRMLNAKPEFDNGNTNFSVLLTVNGLQIKQTDLDPKVWRGNPLQSKICIEYKDYTASQSDKVEELSWDWERVDFTTSNLKKIDPIEGTFVFVNEEGTSLILTKLKEKNFNYFDAF